jgi:ribonuclease J
MSKRPHFLWDYHRAANISKSESEDPPLRRPEDGVLRIIPLGGLGEIGLNMMIYEYGEDIVIVDCGQMFPDEDMLGVDLVVPDVSYLVERLDRVRGILLTHGHEDHIGGLPYILPALPVPVYGGEFTLRLLREKLVEHNLHETTDFRVAAYREPIGLGAFEATFIHVTHSIPGAAAIAMKTPIGTVVHSGDYKIDQAPPDGEGFDFYSMSRLGEEGVLALLGDSTNIEQPGVTPPESSVEKDLNRIFAEAPGAVIVATFSSSIHRLQTLVNMTRAHKRRLFVTGFNLLRNLRIARETGYIDAPEDFIEDIKRYPDCDPSNAVVLTTGSQGEPLSALSRMALNSHRQVQIGEDDTIVLSSRIIPGNERAIFRMINGFARRGAHVIYEGRSHVHVSGHCYSGEMAMLIELLKPHHFIPIHGEARHLMLHRDLAIRMGVDPERATVIENGDVLEIKPDSAEIRGRLNASRVMVDGKSVGETGEIVLRDRMRLSQDGMVVVIMTIDRATDKIVCGPEIISRGFVYMDENEDLIETLRQLVIETFENCDRESKEDWGVVNEEVRRALRRYLRRETERFPMVLPVVMEI